MHFVTIGQEGVQSFYFFFLSGSYCPAGTGSSTEYLCPAGTYNNVTQAQDIFDCRSCTGKVRFTNTNK